MLKKAASVLFALILVSAAVAAAHAGERKTHEIAAEIVSVDLESKTIDFNDADGQKHTAPLTGAAVEAASKFKPGQKVTLICQDNENGSHEAVIAIRPAAK